MRYCGTARRTVKEPGRKWYIWIPVYYSEAAHRYHRILPGFLLPYKHYTVNTIKASEDDHQDLDLYDLPSDSSRIRWHSWLISKAVPVSLHPLISYICDPLQTYRFPHLWPLRHRRL